MTRQTARSPLSWLGALLVVYLAVPLGAFVLRLAGSSDRGFSTPGLWSALRTSVESATVSTAVIALLGVPLAYRLARSTHRLAGIVGVVVQLPLALPPVMSGIVLIYLVGPYTRLGRLFGGRLTGSVTGIVLAQTFVAAPFLIIAARSAFAAVDPALDDLAATLGQRPLARFWKVDLPVAGPGIRAGLLLALLRALGEYGATVLIAYHPYSLPVFTYVQFSSAGIPTTQAPTALALAAAAAALLVSRLRWPERWRPEPEPPAARPPAPAPASVLAFKLDVTVGTFKLRLAHRATSHRLAILGPSGSGKSLTLKSLAGLLGPGADGFEQLILQFLGGRQDGGGVVVLGVEVGDHRRVLLVRQPVPVVDSGVPVGDQAVRSSGGDWRVGDGHPAQPGTPGRYFGGLWCSTTQTRRDGWRRPENRWC